MMSDTDVRETLGSRLGFLLLSVGCAVGLGNVWRFPYIVGKYGGGMFVLLYLVFLLLLGYPILMMELAIGRSAHKGLVGAYRTLANRGKSWWAGIARIIFLGNALLMMYYTTVSGWLVAYSGYYVNGSLSKLETPETIGTFFNNLIASPGRMVFYTLLVVAVGALLCCGGLRKGVENSVKYMMLVLFGIMFIMVFKALTLPNASSGLEFYLVPNWSNFSSNIVETVFAAMGQAFFTLSLGVGSMEIFGSYLGWKKSLFKECCSIILLDTLIALMAGVIIFAACASYNVDAASGPGLIFLSLPNVFNQMAYGQVWGICFFVFLSLAAMTTVVAVFENLIAFLMDEFKFSRLNASLAAGLGMAVLAMPCAMGFNLLSGFKPFGDGSTVLDLEDFLVSQNLLPLGALMSVIFCSYGFGWGQDKFFAECEEGQRWKYPRFFRYYCRLVLPLILILVLVMEYWKFFGN